MARTRRENQTGDERMTRSRTFNLADLFEIVTAEVPERRRLSAARSASPTAN